LELANLHFNVTLLSLPTEVSAYRFTKWFACCRARADTGRQRAYWHLFN